MVDKANMRERIAGSGLKVTLQRLAVFEALLELKNHPTVEQIAAYLKQHYDGISIGTVYKTLETFVAKGLVTRVKDDSDKMRYDAYTDKHHHLYSEENQEIGDYYDEDLDQLLENYFKEKAIPGFEVKDIRLQIVGKFKE